jgi:hypothetical protein
MIQIVIHYFLCPKTESVFTTVMLKKKLAIILKTFLIKIIAWIDVWVHLGPDAVGQAEALGRGANVAGFQ